MRPMPAPDQSDLAARVRQLVWYHSIDLGNGVVTPGLSVSEPLRAADELPPLEGKSVLDIGAWDGYYSYLAERQGAARVVALDHYAWGVDIGARDAYWRECTANGLLPDLSRDTTDFWRSELPGKRGFDLAHEALGSAVEAVVADFGTMDLGSIGTFDVVFYLGVLYHVEDPLGALRRVRSVTGEVAVIETEAVHFRGYDEESFLQFRAGNDLRGDFGNWYVPSIQAIHQLCRSAGFSRVETVRGPPPAPTFSPPAVRRDLLHPLRPKVPPPVVDAWTLSAPSANYRAVVRAYV